MKNVAVSLMAILFAACSGNKSPHSLQQEKEDLSAKELLQGIWLDDETESPLMRVEGDTIYYADAQSTPIAFKIMRDILYTYGNDTTYYKIDKQGIKVLCVHILELVFLPVGISFCIKDFVKNFFARKRRTVNFVLEFGYIVVYESIVHIINGDAYVGVFILRLR